MKTTVNVEVAIVKEEEYYVAYCPALEISSIGNNFLANPVCIAGY
jgi:hypothetical protein